MTQVPLRSLVTVLITAALSLAVVVTPAGAEVCVDSEEVLEGEPLTVCTFEVDPFVGAGGFGTSRDVDGDPAVVNCTHEEQLQNPDCSHISGQ